MKNGLGNSGTWESVENEVRELGDGSRDHRPYRAWNIRQPETERGGGTVKAGTDRGAVGHFDEMIMLIQ